MSQAAQQNLRVEALGLHLSIAPSTNGLVFYNQKKNMSQRSSSVPPVVGSRDSLGADGLVCRETVAPWFRSLSVRYSYNYRATPTLVNDLFPDVTDRQAPSPFHWACTIWPSSALSNYSSLVNYEGIKENKSKASSPKLQGIQTCDHEPCHSDPQHTAPSLLLIPHAPLDCLRVTRQRP